MSPLLSPCSCLQLLLGLVSSSAPPLKALESNCSEKNAKACGYQRVCQETLGASLPKSHFGPRLDLVCTSFAPRSDLDKIAASQNPTRIGFGKALQWSAAWSAAAAVVVACVAASGKVLVNGAGINVHVWISVHMVFNIRGYIFFKIVGHNCAHAS